MSVGGEWKLPYRSKVIGIHAALLSDGKVLLMSYPSKFEDDEHGDHSHQHSHFGSASHLGAYEVIDPESNPEAWSGESYVLENNLFCGGTCFLGDGDFFVSGGQYWAIHNPVLLFNPPYRFNYTFNNSTGWAKRQSMFLGRWYPTCLTLPDGSALIISGAWGIYGIKQLGPFRFVNDRLELFSRKEGLKTLQKIPFDVDLYPFMHLLPNGIIFVHSERTTRFYDYVNNRWIKDDNSSKLLAKTTDHPFSRTNPVQGSSVLLPLLPSKDPPYRARVIVIGGTAKEDPHTDDPATDTAEIMDFGNPNPIWRYANNKMNFKRVMPDALLLPDGKVLVVNGCERGKSDDAVDPVLTPELFDPDNETWAKMADMSVGRYYHATALLLPDGRIMTAGTDREWNVKDHVLHDEYRIEVFTPPYLVGRTRPLIDDVKDEVIYGEVLEVRCGQASEIASACLIRPSSVTHSLNTDQRFVGLEILHSRENSFSVKIPENPNVAPRGYYMLFILNSQGTPSKARFIRII